jgi:SpoVK/Ycf46/Vps4 family AAA+-type ATPase
VSGAEIFSPYVGDSEKAIVELFRQARLAAPTILFIDEIDSLVSARDMEGSKTNHSDKVLSALLTEMDASAWSVESGNGRSNLNALRLTVLYIIVCTATPSPSAPRVATMC